MLYTTNPAFFTAFFVSSFHSTTDAQPKRITGSAYWDAQRSIGEKMMDRAVKTGCRRVVGGGTCMMCQPLVAAAQLRLATPRRKGLYWHLLDQLSPYYARGKRKMLDNCLIVAISLQLMVDMMSTTACCVIVGRCQLPVDVGFIREQFDQRTAVIRRITAHLPMSYWKDSVVGDHRLLLSGSARHCRVTSFQQRRIRFLWIFIASKVDKLSFW